MFHLRSLIPLGHWELVLNLWLLGPCNWPALCDSLSAIWWWCWSTTCPGSIEHDWVVATNNNQGKQKYEMLTLQFPRCESSATLDNRILKPSCNPAVLPPSNVPPVIRHDHGMEHPEYLLMFCLCFLCSFLVSSDKNNTGFASNKDCHHQCDLLQRWSPEKSFGDTCMVNERPEYFSGKYCCWFGILHSLVIFALGFKLLGPR